MRVLRINEQMQVIRHEAVRQNMDFTLGAAAAELLQAEPHQRAIEFPPPLLIGERE